MIGTQKRKNQHSPEIPCTAAAKRTIINYTLHIPGHLHRHQKCSWECHSGGAGCVRDLADAMAIGHHSIQFLGNDTCLRVCTREPPNVEHPLQIFQSSSCDGHLEDSDLINFLGDARFFHLGSARWACRPSIIWEGFQKFHASRSFRSRLRDMVIGWRSLLPVTFLE